MSKFWKILIAVIIVVAISVASTIGIIKYNEKKKSNVDENEVATVSFNVKIGSIDDGGNIADNDLSIVSTDLIYCEKITGVSLNEKASIYYRVAFYDSEENYISTTGKLTGALLSYPATAKYLRIEITPLNLDKDKLDTNDISVYMDMLNLGIK